ncbi:MAG: ATP-binding cassette domain-containing protein, partial [Paracoccaceae bacterium]|nr:ATP-binding cassette domain-containing protein [Paracoccaceae bacterium]
MTDPLLKIENVVVDFRTIHGTVNAVRGLSYEVARGETLAVVGESGSGKSVTARAIMSMLAENARVGADSRIWFDGTDLSELSELEMQEIR